MNLNHRIAAGALIENEHGQILLMRSLHNKNPKHEFWVPPGGGAEGDEDIRNTVRRETLEECGLQVECLQLAYIEETIWTDSNTRHLKMWFTTKLLGGTLDWNNNPATSENIIGAAWFSQADMEGKIIFPLVLRHEYWLDRETGFTTPRFIGIRQVTFHE
jgi:8-oxo-dGTP diphosphatase